MSKYFRWKRLSSSNKGADESASEPPVPTSKKRAADMMAVFTDDARLMDDADTKTASRLADDLAAHLLSRYTAVRTDNMMVGVRYILFFAAIWGVGQSAFNFANGESFAGSGYITFYMLLGILISFWFCRQINKRARRHTDAYEADVAKFVALVREKTNRLSEGLTAQRQIIVDGRPKKNAVAAFANARVLTLSGLRFFDVTPVLSDVENDRCPSLADRMAAMAHKRLQQFRTVTRERSILLSAFIAGAVVLYWMAHPAPTFPPPPKWILIPVFIIAMNPGGPITSLLIVAALLTAPFIIAPHYSRWRASVRPLEAFQTDALSGLVNDLRVQVLAAIVIRKSEMIERYADALERLEAMVGGTFSSVTNKALPNLQRSGLTNGRPIEAAQPVLDLAGSDTARPALSGAPRIHRVDPNNPRSIGAL